jgi:subtilase family serine protease
MSGVVALACFATLTALAGAAVPIRVTQSIDETKLVTLPGHLLPWLNASLDRGPVEDSMAFEHIQLVLQRSPEQEAELNQLMEELNDKNSPNYHHWLTAAEFGERFGVAQEDIDSITGWLESHGFRVDKVYPSRMLIDFTGNVGELREGFHTSIHNIDYKGEAHIANMSNPQVPEALAPVIKGIFSLNDIRPHPLYQLARDYTFAGCANSVDYPEQTGTCYAITPQDNAVIYNLNPLWSAGISGQGQTIGLIEDTNTYTTGTAGTTDSDWTTYRNTFGLSGYSSTYSTVHPGGCTNPGINGDDGEAAIDVEVA